MCKTAAANGQANVPAAPAPAAPKKQQSFKALDRVDARFQKGELWYPGTIATALPNDCYDIAYVRACVEINLHAIIASTAWEV